VCLHRRNIASIETKDFSVQFLYSISRITRWESLSLRIFCERHDSLTFRFSGPTFSAPENSTPQNSQLRNKKGEVTKRCMRKVWHNGEPVACYIPFSRGKLCMYVSRGPCPEVLRSIISRQSLHPPLRDCSGPLMLDVGLFLPSLLVFRVSWSLQL